jgi:hypothetical protein
MAKVAQQSPVSRNSRTNNQDSDISPSLRRANIVCHPDLLTDQEYAASIVQNFSEHTEYCCDPLKEEVIKKVLDIKSFDYKALN